MGALIKLVLNYPFYRDSLRAKREPAKKLKCAIRGSVVDECDMTKTNPQVVAAQERNEVASVAHDADASDTFGHRQHKTIQSLCVGKVAKYTSRNKASQLWSASRYRSHPPDSLTDSHRKDGSRLS